MRGYVLSSAACGVSQIFPACGAPKYGVGPTPNLGRLYPCGSQNWDGRKKGGCRHRQTASNMAVFGLLLILFAQMASDSHLLSVDSYFDPLFIGGFIKENDQIGNFDIISSKVVRWIQDLLSILSIPLKLLNCQFWRRSNHPSSRNES